MRHSAGSESSVPSFESSSVQPLRVRKNVSIAAGDADHDADYPPELRVARRRAGAAACTFMPYMPVSTVIGMKIVEMIVSTFMTPFS